MEKEILMFNYWEHIKREKELAMVLPPDHPQRIAIHNAANKILESLKPQPNAK